MLFFLSFCRAVRHEKYLADLVQDKMTSNRSPQMFYQSQQKITSLIDVVPTQKVISFFIALFCSDCLVYYTDYLLTILFQKFECIF